MPNRGKFIAALAGLLAAFLVASPAASLDIEVREIDRALRNQYMSASMPEAHRLLAGYTVLTKARGFSGRVQAVIPFSSVAVLYMAPNGEVLAWSDKSARVEAGRWQIQANGRNDVCLFFPMGKGAGACTNLFINNAWIEQSTKGNPFGLKAGASVPFKMGRFGVSLKNLAAKLP